MLFAHAPSRLLAASPVYRGASLPGDILRGAEGGDPGYAGGEQGGVVGELHAVPLPGSNVSPSLSVDRELVASCRC